MNSESTSWQSEPVWGIQTRSDRRGMWEWRLISPDSGTTYGTARKYKTKESALEAAAQAAALHITEL